MKIIEFVSIILFSIILIDFFFYTDSNVMTVSFISNEFMFLIYLLFSLSLIINMLILVNEFYKEYKENVEG